MKTTPEQIISILRRDPRNNITVFHRNENSAGALSHAVGVTINYHEPYYDGWAPALAMQEQFIGMAELLQVAPLLTREDWGDKTIGGTIYRLKETQ